MRQNESYPSFNGMNRPAMVFGVPMVAASFIRPLFYVVSGFLELPQLGIL